jgi:hypothetical protein
MRRIHVVIDRLVLRGFAPEDRRAVAQGLEEGIARLLSGPQAYAALEALGSVESLPAAPVAVDSARPRVTGLRAAASVTAALAPASHGREPGGRNS